MPGDAPFEASYLHARLPVAADDELQQVGVAVVWCGGEGRGRVLESVPLRLHRCFCPA